MRSVPAGAEPLLYPADSASIGPPGCYQRAGFRAWKVECDFVSVARDYPNEHDENRTPVQAML